MKKAMKKLISIARGTPKKAPPAKVEKGLKGSAVKASKQVPSTKNAGKAAGKKGAPPIEMEAELQTVDPESRRTCRVIGCMMPATTAGYSRICYIKYWKQIKKKDDILAEGVVHRYIKEIVEKYPEKIVLAIRHDLISDEAYAQMIRELDLYGGVDELEHELAIGEDDNANEESMDDIKQNITKDDEDF